MALARWSGSDPCAIKGRQPADAQVEPTFFTAHANGSRRGARAVHVRSCRWRGRAQCVAGVAESGRYSKVSRAVCSPASMSWAALSMTCAQAPQ